MAHNNLIYLDDPNIGELEKKHLIKAIDSGYVSTYGPFVSEFEKEVARYLGVEKAVATQSGTAAIHATLYEAGIGKGDEVIVPALTFIGTVNPITYVGATPVFVDVDRRTWLIDPFDIERHITKRTKAVIPVHLYGNPCDMDSIMAIAKNNNLYVIEDAAESLGAKYKGKYTGTIGDFGCFSFNGNKIITTGGGGMIVGKNNKRMEHIRFLVNQARDETRPHYHSEIGFNYRMTNIVASLGLAQMKKLDKFLDIKRRINKIYKEELNDIPYVQFQKEYDKTQSSYWLTSLLFKKGIDVIRLQGELRKERIPVRQVFRSIADLPPYQACQRSKLSNTNYISKNGLCLPSSTLNTMEGVYYVCKKIRKLFSAMP